VIDHHKIGDLMTGYPLILRFEPLASTNSILYKMYIESGISIDKSIATLMLGGILSDTLHFRSPTTTDFERSIVPILAEIAQIDDVEEFAMKMFALKSDLGDISAYQLIKEIDAKEFTFGEQKSLIVCIETTNPDYCLNRKNEIIQTIQTIKESE
jgi:manganese-dependent inorganic pyrophosphatase